MYGSCNSVRCAFHVWSDDTPRKLKQVICPYILRFTRFTFTTGHYRTLQRCIGLLRPKAHTNPGTRMREAERGDRDDLDGRGTTVLIENCSTNLT